MYKGGRFEHTGMEERCAQLCQSEAAWCCGELLVVVVVVVKFTIKGS